MKTTPNRMKFFMNIYIPYLGAGVKVEYISQDWKELRTSLRPRWYNKNVVGTHFGGNLYSMVDPIIMLLLMNLLGPEYIVWDYSANIHFIKASKKKVTCNLKISDEQIEDIIAHTDNGEKYLPTYTLEIKDDESRLIALIEKVLYIKKKIR